MRVIAVVLWLICTISVQGQDSNASVASADSLSLLLEYYDSLAPDSNWLVSNGDSTLLSDTFAIDSMPLANEAIDSSEIYQLDDRLEASPLENQQKTWVFLILFLVALLVGVTRFINPGVHDSLISSVFSLKSNDDNYEPRGDVKSFILVLFFVIQCLIFGLFFYAFTNYDTLFTFDSSIIDYLLLLTVIILAFLLKYFAYKFTGDLLVMDSFSRDTISFLLALGYLFSLLLLPILALKYYNMAEWVQHYSLWYFYALFGLYFLYRGIKLLLTSYRNFSFNKIYLFLYLCAVEILPVVLILNAWFNFQ